MLLAEDNALNCRVATAQLERRGCYVDVVHDGSEAVEILDDEYYDLVLMDCHMLELDGYEATAP